GLDLTDHWHWLGEALVQDFDLRAWGVRAPFGSITARLAVSGDDAGFSAHGSVNPTALHAGVFEAQFSGSYADRVLTARHMELPLIPADVSGTLAKDSFAFDSAEIDLFGGHASVSGQVVWSPLESWSVQGHVSGINPGALRADLPGSVSFMLAASGRGFDTRGDLSASFSGVSGKLRGVAASGSGSVTRAGNTWGFSAVRVGLGSARVALDGHLNER